MRSFTGLGGDQHTGMLVVDSVLPGGPADGALQPGDVLVRLAGSAATSFLPLEAALDDAVGTSVALDIERAGTAMTVELAVQVTSTLQFRSSAKELERGGHQHGAGHRRRRDGRDRGVRVQVGGLD